MDIEIGGPHVAGPQSVVLRRRHQAAGKIIEAHLKARYLGEGSGVERGVIDRLDGVSV
jgi:hypothetical protein